MKLSLLLLIRLQNVQELLVRILIIRITRFDLVQIVNGVVELFLGLCRFGVLVAEVAQERGGGCSLWVLQARRECFVWGLNMMRNLEALLWC